MCVHVIVFSTNPDDQSSCPGKGYSATLEIDLEASVDLETTYAYYLSGTFIPPSTPEVYAYLGMEPFAYVGLYMKGDAQMQYTSLRKKIIDTLSYPGLAIKGIAAVGPTLDIYGQVRKCLTFRNLKQFNMGNRSMGK